MRIETRITLLGIVLPDNMSIRIMAMMLVKS
jgi:hypothetical protein